MFCDDLDGPRSRAAIFVNRPSGVRTKLIGVIFIAQQTRKRALQFGGQRVTFGRSQLKERVPPEKIPANLAKILHVRSDDDRLRVKRRLQNIVSAFRNEASADEDDRSEPVERRKLSDRIEQDHVSGVAIPIGRRTARHSQS